MSDADRPRNFTEPDREPPDSRPRSGLVIGPSEGGPDVQVVPTRMIAAELERQPGFRSYTLVRTGEWEVVAVTVFDSEGELRAAIDSIAELVRQRVAPFVEPGPDRHEGTLLCHVAA